MKFRILFTLTLSCSLFFSLQSQVRLHKEGDYRIGLTQKNIQPQDLSPSIMFDNESASTYLRIENTNILVPLHEQKERKNALEKWGRILTFIGAPLLVGGIIMVAKSDALYYNCVNGYCEGDPLGGFGVVVLALGIPLTIGGGILWGLGARKRKRK